MGGCAGLNRFFKMGGCAKGMPKNRRFFAVPFVGKDVPSKASEFSHPDIVIGLSILAYRYEGMRRTDMIFVLRALREQMAAESGPHAKRPACLTWIRWVELAGKRVRGTQRHASGAPTPRSWMGRTGCPRPG